MVCVSPRALRLVGDFSCDCMFWDDRGGGLTGKPMGPQVDTANIGTILSINHVDSRSFSSRCWAFRRTHPSADPIRLLCIRLALPLTLSLPSGFVPSTKLTVGASPRALKLVKGFSFDYMFWDERGGGLAPVGPRVDTATIRTVIIIIIIISAHKSDLSYPWSQTQASLSIPSLHPKNTNKRREREEKNNRRENLPRSDRRGREKIKQEQKNIEHKSRGLGKF